MNWLIGGIDLNYLTTDCRFTFGSIFIHLYEQFTLAADFSYTVGTMMC